MKDTDKMQASYYTIAGPSCYLPTCVYHYCACKAHESNKVNQYNYILRSPLVILLFY